MARVSAASCHTGDPADAARLPLEEPAQAEWILLAFLCSAAVIPLLFIARAADGSTFTSWRWVFSEELALRAELLLVPALLGALAAARLSQRGPARHLLLVLAPVAAVLPLWQAPETVLDASRYFVQARWLSEYGVARFVHEWGRGIDAWTDLPLVPFLYGVAFRTLGESRPVAQALGTALFASTAALAWSIGRELWDEETGLHAGLLLVGVPLLLAQVPLLLVDVPTMFLVALATRALLSAVRRGGVLRTAACALALCAAALAKYSAVPALAVLTVAAVAAGPAPRRTAAGRAAAAVLLAAAMAAALLAARPDAVASQLRLLAGYQWSGLGRWREGFASTFLFQAHPFLVALAAAGALTAARERDRRFLVAGAGALLAVLVGSTRARYAIPLLPFLALAAARGLRALPDRGTRTLVAWCVVASSVVIAWTGYLPFLSRTSFANLQAAGERLDALPGRTVEVWALPQQASSGSTFAAIPLLDYYTRKRIVSPQEWPLRAGGAQAGTSPLRFSWEMRRPPFYAAPEGERAPALVVLSSEPLPRPLPPPLRERERLDASSGAFLYRTVVTIHARD
jgi:4-amino-4-deoxy-L-arabinose transferase-like glycosyltransferase